MEHTKEAILEMLQLAWTNQDLELRLKAYALWKAYRAQASV